MEYKEQRILQFEQWWRYCECLPDIVEAVDETRHNIQVYPIMPEQMEWGKRKRTVAGKTAENVQVTDGNILEDVLCLRKDCGTERTVILNFVSVVHRGGGVLRGEVCPEADLCRTSTLYFSMQTEIVEEQLYHTKQPNSVMYLPRVYCTVGGQWITADIIICAYPFWIKEKTDWLKEMERRIYAMLWAAERNTTGRILLDSRLPCQDRLLEYEWARLITKL